MTESERPAAVALLRVRYADRPGVYYWAALRPVAERLADDAETSGQADQIEILDAAAFVVSASVTPGDVAGRVILLGVQRPDGTWSQPAATGRRAERN